MLLPVPAVYYGADTEKDCTCHNAIPQVFYCAANETNTENIFTYEYDFNTSVTHTENLTLDYWGENTCSHNRYAYAYGNPFVYIDPDGEFIITAIIVGAVIGAAIGAYSGYKIAESKNATGWNMAGYILGGAAIGAVGGGAAGAVGAVVGGAISVGGFVGGAITGAAAGATGGFINGAGMTWLGGGSFEQGMTNGVIGAGVGAATGAFLGGTLQGISALRQGNNFWNGKPLTTPAPPNTTNTDISKPNTKALQLEDKLRNEVKMAVPDKQSAIYKDNYLHKVTGPDGQHSWNSRTVEIVVDNGKVFPITGGDGKSAVLVQQLGKHHGTDGIFEIIVRNGEITHQRFIPGGIITGQPQQIVPNVSGSVSPGFKWWK